jgi:hypothetical protein
VAGLVDVHGDLRRRGKDVEGRYQHGDSKQGFNINAHGDLSLKGASFGLVSLPVNSQLGRFEQRSALLLDAEKSEC